MCTVLLLAAPTSFLGRCGRYDAPPSYVADFIFCSSDSSQVSVDTVHPSLLRSSSLSSPRWYHLHSLSNDVGYRLFTAPNHQSSFPAPLCDVLYLQPLPGVIIAHMIYSCLATCLLHIFISVISSFFTICTVTTV